MWISGDAGDGEAGSPDDEREIDALWRAVRQEEAKKLRRTRCGGATKCRNPDRCR